MKANKTSLKLRVCLLITLLCVTLVAAYGLQFGSSAGEIIVDNSNATFVGTWAKSTLVPGYYGSNYQSHICGKGANTATWSFNIPTAGNWQVYAWWTSGLTRASNAKYTINFAGASSVVTVNQQTNGGSWQSLGVFSFNPGSYSVILSDNANGFVVADAIKLVPVSQSSLTTYIAENQYPDWTSEITSGWQTIVAITLPNLPAGYYKAEVDAHSFQSNAVLGIGIGVDTQTADETTQRFYDSLGETDVRQGVHTQETFYLPAGSHTFYLRAGNTGSTGTIQLQYSHITVTYFANGQIGSGWVAY